MVGFEAKAPLSTFVTLFGRITLVSLLFWKAICPISFNVFGKLSIPVRPLSINARSPIFSRCDGNDTYSKPSVLVAKSPLVFVVPAISVIYCPSVFLSGSSRFLFVFLFSIPLSDKPVIVVPS